MPTCRMAPDSNAFRVNLIDLSVGTQPTDRRLDIMDLGREDGIATQAVIDTDSHEAVAGHERTPIGDSLLARTRAPTTTVEPDRGRAVRRRTIMWVQHIQRQRNAVGHTVQHAGNKRE